MGVIVLAVGFATSNLNIEVWIRLIIKIFVGIVAYVLIAKDELRWFFTHYFSRPTEQDLNE